MKFTFVADTNRFTDVHLVGNTTLGYKGEVLHDAAFDIAYAYIHPQKYAVGENNSDEYGDYVELTRVFDFVDMDYLENLFSKNGLVDFLKKTSKEKIETEVTKATDGMNREQLRTAGKAIKSELKKLIADSDKQYDDIHDIIVAFRQLMPYTRMLISRDGYLIPMDDKYFRINPNNLGIKYGGEITCVGMITNIIGADTDPNDPNNIFATLQLQLMKFYAQFYLQMQKICVSSTQLRYFMGCKYHLEYCSKHTAHRSTTGGLCHVYSQSINRCSGVPCTYPSKSPPRTSCAYSNGLL